MEKEQVEYERRKVDAMGMEYEYRIIPGGLGHLVYVKNTTTGKERKTLRVKHYIQHYTISSTALIRWWRGGMLVRVCWARR